MFESYDQKLDVFAFYDRFHEILPTVLGLAIWIARKTRYMFERYDQNLIVFSIYGRFLELLPTVLGVPRIFKKTVRLDTCLRVKTKNSSFSHFMAILMSY